MQASTSSIYPVYIKTTGAERAPSTIAILTALILLAASAPEAGIVPAGEISPLSDSRADLSLNDVVAHLESRLPGAYKQESYKLGKLVLELSERHQFSPSFILSVIETESTFRPTVVSKAGAVGLMQLLPSTAREVAGKYGIKSYRTPADLNNPQTNMRLGVAYLSYLRKQFGNSIHYVAAYNLGPTALRRRLRSGDYELGAIDPYVRVIHERSRTMRNSRAVETLPALNSNAAVMAASL